MDQFETFDDPACIFCDQPIAPGVHDPCAINLVTRIDRPRLQQKEQTFFCHMHCLQSRSAMHPGVFYIVEPGFPTVGECKT
ncbi:MAG TPA: hypothetical protein VLC08_07040 [Chitinolyticbacter sp.]|uniref:hypothetical protein n=1 Tax=Chitinolyticbacter albus TaxID=2961951 RepID=UPI002108B85A|nr:hypothetical protein [Chitinolyticbacter albus]HSC80090.1 hypothetical protein [Chitinolyticbacter sp.]